MPVFTVGRLFNLLLFDSRHLCIRQSLVDCGRSSPSRTLHFIHDRQSGLRWLNIIDCQSVVARLLYKDERVLLDHRTRFVYRQLSKGLSIRVRMGYLVNIVLESFAHDCCRIGAISA